MAHLFPNDFSLGAVNDDNLEEMFKRVDMLEKEAPKTMRKAEEIIKEMEDDQNAFKFAGGVQFQSVWSAFSHIFFIVSRTLLVLFIFALFFLVKNEISKMKKK